jgi:hypothetical protein
MAIPELEKAGKSVQLKRAVEYMADLGERAGGLPTDGAASRGDKMDLEVSLAFSEFSSGTRSSLAPSSQPPGARTLILWIIIYLP